MKFEDFASGAAAEVRRVAGGMTPNQVRPEPTRSVKPWLAFAGGFAAVLAIGIGLGVMLGNDGAPDTTLPGTMAPETVCLEPPPGFAADREDEFRLVVTPAMVAPGDRATIDISVDAFLEHIVGLFVGRDTEWECWDGNEWIRTHILMKETEAEPIVIGSGHPDYFYLPLRAEIVIPDVLPGIYRISQRSWAVSADTSGDDPDDGGEPAESGYHAWAIVEVVASPPPITTIPDEITTLPPPSEPCPPGDLDELDELDFGGWAPAGVICEGPLIGSWELMEVEIAGVPFDIPSFSPFGWRSGGLAFWDDGLWTGMACNSFQGRYQMTDDTIDARFGWTTLVGCFDEPGEVERILQHGWLEQTANYEVVGDTLTIRSGDIVMTLVRLDPNAPEKPLTASPSCPAVPRGSEQEVDEAEFSMGIAQRSVSPGSIVELHIGLPADAAEIHATGVAATWQCWNGSTWIDTHLLDKGIDDTVFSTPGVRSSDQQWAVRDLGVRVPTTVRIMIPDVPPGTYRIVDSMSGRQPGSRPLLSYLLVDVR